jgi:hypothetical protein
VAQAVQDKVVEFGEKVRSADAREALTAFFEKRPPRFNTGESAWPETLIIEWAWASATELTRLVRRHELQVSAEETPESMCTIQLLLQEHVIVSQVRDC